MTFKPFLDAPLIIQLHAASAIVALVTGPIALFRRRRDGVHKGMGRLWVASMAVTALSAAFIFELRMIGPFSPIHLLVPLTLYGLWRGVMLIRRGEVAAHARQMRGLYFSAIGVAGLFTLLPGRMMSQMLAPEAPWLGFACAAAVLAWGVWRARAAVPNRVAAGD